MVHPKLTLAVKHGWNYACGLKLFPSTDPEKITFILTHCKMRKREYMVPKNSPGSYSQSKHILLCL